jgi:hypothetical protein
MARVAVPGGRQATVFTQSAADSFGLIKATARSIWRRSSSRVIKKYPSSGDRAQMS